MSRTIVTKRMAKPIAGTTIQTVSFLMLTDEAATRVASIAIHWFREGSYRSVFPDIMTDRDSTPANVIAS